MVSVSCSNKWSLFDNQLAEHPYYLYHQLYPWSIQGPTLIQYLIIFAILLMCVLPLSIAPGIASTPFFLTISLHCMWYHLPHFWTMIHEPYGCEVFHAFPLWMQKSTSCCHLKYYCNICWAMFFSFFWLVLGQGVSCIVFGLKHPCSGHYLPASHCTLLSQPRPLHHAYMRMRGYTFLLQSHVYNDHYFQRSMRNELAYFSPMSYLWEVLHNSLPWVILGQACIIHSQELLLGL